MARPLHPDESDDGAAPDDPARPAGPASTEEVDASGDELGPDTATRPVPSPEQLDKIAVDVRIRRRPRYGVFVAMGMLLVGGTGLVWALSVPQSTHENWGASVWVTTLTAAALGALLGAGVAVFADWRSRRS